MAYDNRERKIKKERPKWPIIRLRRRLLRPKLAHETNHIRTGCVPNHQK